MPTPSPRDAAIAGRTLVVVDDGLGVAPHLATRLAAGGADVQVVAASARIARPDVHGLIDLPGLRFVSALSWPVRTMSAAAKAAG